MAERLLWSPPLPGRQVSTTSDIIWTAVLSAGVWASSVSKLASGVEARDSVSDLSRKHPLRFRQFAWDRRWRGHGRRPANGQPGRLTLGGRRTHQHRPGRERPMRHPVRMGMGERLGESDAPDRCGRLLGVAGPRGEQGPPGSTGATGPQGPVDPKVAKGRRATRGPRAPREPRENKVRAAMPASRAPGSSPRASSSTAPP